MDAIQSFLYKFPQPAPHKRTEPVEELWLSLPRTGTESLSVGLQKLGLDTYHGWDLVFEPHGRKLQFCHELVKRNHHGTRDGDMQVSSAEFDLLIGDRQAVIDSLSMLLAPELLAAYPGAKVVLNGRRDVSQIVRAIAAGRVNQCGRLSCLSAAVSSVDCSTRLRSSV
ncbi:hypothetical protein AnigIFM50267_004686 [Aspergillus niger]|nr:hypothetical protein AnigIFM50267_004686 [Aspergillus niger]